MKPSHYVPLLFIFLTIIRGSDITKLISFTLPYYNALLVPTRPIKYQVLVTFLFAFFGYLRWASKTYDDFLTPIFLDRELNHSICSGGGPPSQCLPIHTVVQVSVLPIGSGQLGSGKDQIKGRSPELLQVASLQIREEDGRRYLHSGHGDPYHARGV